MLTKSRGQEWRRRASLIARRRLRRSLGFSSGSFRMTEHYEEISPAIHFTVRMRECDAIREVAALATVAQLQMVVQIRSESLQKRG
jgi:hypothetical protein